ncbi:hypothetical protein [Pseudomonas oryzihabitans]|uniref:Uncharacterized protein n=1 Tax=Pseudomonas oryzihabitans TaxID=47885 RepID=A0ABX3IQP7_9PSED|nr:hypothetical protein [Pseudomonas psychrotolerans]ONN70671.1 hypothetical protein BVL52_20775 [Pseudomonas psychrotolerans]
MTGPLDYQIAKLSPKKRDMIVIKVDASLTRDQLHRLGEQYIPYFEEVGCKVVVLGREVDLQVVEAVPE